MCWKTWFYQIPFSDFKYFFALAYGYFDGNLDSANEFNNIAS